MLTPEETLGEWRALVRGATATLIGGGKTFDPLKAGDSEFIVHVNTHWMRHRGPIDILYFSCGDDLDLAMFDEPELYTTLQFVWLSASNLLFNGKKQIARFTVVKEILAERGVSTLLYAVAPPQAFDQFEMLMNLGPNYLWTKELANRWNFHPFTGTAALYHLVMESGIGKLRVDGMDFFMNDNGEIPKFAGAHEVQPQIRCMKDLCTETGRVELSDVLAQIVHGKH